VWLFIVEAVAGTGVFAASFIDLDIVNKGDFIGNEGRLLVKTGNNFRFSCFVASYTTIALLKQTIEGLGGKSAHKQKVYFKGQWQQGDSMTMAECGIAANNEILLLMND